jgi:hypothetical protein
LNSETRPGLTGRISLIRVLQGLAQLTLREYSTNAQKRQILFSILPEITESLGCRSDCRAVFRNSEGLTISLYSNKQILM